MLDEGTITILIHKYKFRWKKQLQDRFFKHIRYNILGLKTAIESKVNYFTMFDLKPHDNELVVKNNFNFLKQNYFTKLEVDNDHLYLLGMVEGLIDEDHYVSYVEQVIADHPDKKILYLPHRREIMSKKLQALFGDKLSLFQPDAPVELDFMMRGIYPMHIVSLFSTALFTLKQIYSNAEIEAYVIADDDLLADVQDTKDVYSLLEKNGVICVALKKHK